MVRNWRLSGIKEKVGLLIWSILEVLPVAVNVVCGNHIVKEWGFIIFAGN
jgi:hypothetical protein